jgi:spermidine/putrescine transport system substrate-binding protein
MIENNPDLAVFFPEEQGFNMFIDAMCIPYCCQEKEAAELFIDFLCEPEISGKDMNAIGYSTPITAAKEYMDPEMVESELAYPGEEILANATSYAYLPEEITQLVEALFQEATKLID